MNIAQNLNTTKKFLIKNGCKLIAVSKKHPESSIQEAKKAGVCHFGESYIQEVIQKSAVFKGVNLHFIGHLQSNKAKDAVQHCQFIHSIDRIKLATTIEKACVKLNKRIGGFVQINLTNEASKGGAHPDDLEELVTYIQQHCPHIDLLGLMYIPPKGVNPDPLYKEVARLNQQYQFKELSMGMSGDYETAIKNGATYVRIGTAIFGQR